MLIVAHDDDLRLLLKVIVDRDPRLQVVGDAATSSEGFDRAAALRPDLIVLDERVGSEAGLDLAEDLSAVAPHTMILLLAPPFRTRTAPSIAVDRVLGKDDLRSLPHAIARLLELRPVTGDEPLAGSG